MSDESPSKTIVVQIGNSDDKLTQLEWAAFVVGVRTLINKYCYDVHFEGGSAHDKSWQNVCFVGSIKTSMLPTLKQHISNVGKAWKQDSVAIIAGDVEFI